MASSSLSIPGSEGNRGRGEEREATAWPVPASSKVPAQRSGPGILRDLGTWNHWAHSNHL